MGKEMSKGARAAFQAACFLSMLFLGLYYTAYQSIVDIVAAYFKTPEAAFGFVISMHFIGSIAGTLVSGEISERVGKKAVIMASLALVLIGAMCSYVSAGIFVACVGIFLVGFGFTALESMLASVLSDESGEKRGRALSFLNVFFSFGAVAAPMMVSYLFDLGRAWREVYLCCAALTLVFIAAFGFIRFGAKPKRNIGSKPVTLEILRVPAYVITLIISFCYLGIETGLGFWAKPIMAAVGGTAEHAALALSLLWLAMIPGRAVVGIFYKHKGLVFSLCMILGALGGVLMLFSNSVATRLVCYFIMGFGAAPSWPVINTLALEVASKYSGACVSFILVVSSLGGVLWPPVHSGIAAFMGVDSTIVCVMLMYAAMLALYALYRRAAERPGAIVLLADAE